MSFTFDWMKLHQRRLAQHLGAVLHRNSCMTDRAHDLRAANPAAEAHEDHEVLVAIRLHRGLHFVLRRLQFFLKRVPFVVLGELVDALAAAEHVLAHAERLRQLDDVGADVLHLLAVLRFDGDETVGNQAAKIERDLRAIAVGHRDRSAILARPIWFARFAQAPRTSSPGVGIVSVSVLIALAI